MENRVIQCTQKQLANEIFNIAKELGMLIHFDKSDYTVMGLYVTKPGASKNLRTLLQALENVVDRVTDARIPPSESAPLINMLENMFNSLNRVMAQPIGTLN